MTWIKYYPIIYLLPKLSLANILITTSKPKFYFLATEGDVILKSPSFVVEVARLVPLSVTEMPSTEMDEVAPVTLPFTLIYWARTMAVVEENTKNTSSSFFILFLFWLLKNDCVFL